VGGAAGAETGAGGLLDQCKITISDSSLEMNAPALILQRPTKWRFARRKVWPLRGNDVQHQMQLLRLDQTKDSRTQSGTKYARNFIHIYYIDYSYLTLLFFFNMLNHNIYYLFLLS
jgi:hypothetical protein